MTKDFAKTIHDLPDDIVAVATIEGIVEWNIENIIDQPIEGLLYDLNRDMATNYTRLANNDQRAINDIAMVKILAWLIKERGEMI